MVPNRIIRWIAVVMLSVVSAHAQQTPPAYAAFLGSGSPVIWNPWSSAAAFGALGYTPPAVGLYCQASAGSAWTPCNPGGTGTFVTQLIAGTDITLSPANGIGVVTITASSTAATAFSALTSSTNTQAAMLVGTGASLAPTGTGTIAATTIQAGVTNNLVYQTAANTTGFIAPVNNAVLVTNGSGVPSESTTLPSGLTAPSLTVTTAFTATGLVTNNDLVNAATTVNGQSCVLGAACTVTANNPNALTMNNAGSGAASGSTYNGGSAVTLSYNTIGAAPLASPAFTGTPTAPTPAQNNNSTTLPTTAYVDLAVANAVAGVNPAVAVLAASTANVVGTYTQVGGGIGDTFTVTTTGTFSLDGIAINTIGQRVLLKNQSTPSQNGVYTATVVGVSLVSPVFTRALDYDTPSDVNNTGAIPVQSGTVNTTTSWLLTSQVTSIGSSGSPLTYAQFSYNPSGTLSPASVLATGIVDGTAPITITTGTTANLGSTYNSGYTYNQEATAATAVAYTLPTAAAGKQYCVGNSYNGSAATTGVLTVNTSASGQFIIGSAGTISATGGNVTSGGAGGDAACFVGVDATHWQQYIQVGTWVLH